jgi:hypothetical protein
VNRFKTPFLIVLFSVVLGCGSAFASPVSYFGYDFSTKPILDAEKSESNTEDDLMCWAAAAANVLVATGWGSVYSASEDSIFGYYQDHWTDAGGLPEFAWEWWFDGTNAMQGESGWSQVDVAGGAFYPETIFLDYYSRTWDDALVLSAIDQYLHAGDGVTLALYGPGGHSITVWGYDYDDATGDYLGIWVTDSDDDKTDPTPENELKYYDVLYSGDQWFLQNFYDSNDWYIGEVMALGYMPTAGPVPEPATVILFGCGILALAGAGRKRFKKSEASPE